MEFKRDNLLSGSTWTRTLRFALTTEVKEPFPEFEVVLPMPNANLKPKLVFAHPAHATGLPDVDAALIVQYERRATRTP